MDSRRASSAPSFLKYVIETSDSICSAAARFVFPRAPFTAARTTPWSFVGTAGTRSFWEIASSLRMKAVVETSDIGADSAPATSSAKLPKAVVRLGWVSFLTDVSSEMIVPLLPAFLATLPGSPAMALGWIEGVAETTASLFKVVSGRLADRAAATKPKGGKLPRSFWNAAIPVTLFALASSSDTFLLLKARDVGVSAALLPVLWALGNAVRAGLGRWGGGLSDRLGRRPLLLSAWGLYAACYAAFAFVTTALPLVLVFAVYSTYAALSEGAERALVADLVGADARGRAFGWLHGLVGFAALPASAVFGFLWERFGSRTAFLAGAAVAALAALALLALVPRSAGARER